MPRLMIGLLLLAVGSLSGCGGSGTESRIATSPHGGKLVELPASKGFVELTTEHGVPSKQGRKEPIKSRILAYFLQTDGTTALSPAPTDVKVTLGAGGNGVAVNLAAQSKEPGQFASDPGEYPDELRGQIDFQLDGKPVQATFAFR